MFNPKSLAQKGNYTAGKNLTKKEFNKLRTKFGQTQKKLQRTEQVLQEAIDNKAPPMEIMNKRRAMNKAKGRHSINQDKFQQALYDKKLYTSSNQGLKTLGLGAAGAIVAREAYKRLNKPKLSQMQKLKKKYAVPVLGVGGLSGLSYLGTAGTEKSAGAKDMNSKNKANIVMRSKEVGVDDAMKSARTPKEKKAILAQLRKSKGSEKRAYSRGEGTMLTERPIYELGEDELKRRLAYERGEAGLRSLMGGLGIGAVGALQGGAIGGAPGALGGLVAGGLLGAGGGYLSSKLRELEAAREYKRRKSYKMRKELEDFKRRKGKTKTANKKLLAAGAGLGALGGLAGYSASDRGAAGRGTVAGAIGGGVGGTLGAIGGGAAGGLVTAKGLLSVLKRQDPKMYKRLEREARYNPNTAKFMEKLQRKFRGTDQEAKKKIEELGILTALGGGMGAAGGLVSGTIAGGMFGGATAGRRDAAKQKMTSQKRSRKYEDYK